MSQPPRAFVVRYARYGSAGEIVAAMHRRVAARSLKQAKALARAYRPDGFGIAAVGEASRLDRQPWIGSPTQD